MRPTEVLFVIVDYFCSYSFWDWAILIIIFAIWVAAGWKLFFA